MPRFVSPVAETSKASWNVLSPLDPKLSGRATMQSSQSIWCAGTMAVNAPLKTGYSVRAATTSWDRVECVELCFLMATGPTAPMMSARLRATR